MSGVGARRIRIAWFYGAAGGAAGNASSLATYCSDLLLPLLRDEFEIEIFSDKPGLVFSDLPVHHFVCAYVRHRAEPFDLFFYQLEDGLAGRFMRMHLGLAPGVVWGHDLVLRDLGPEGVHTSPWEHTVAQLSDPTIDFRARTTPPHQLWPYAWREVAVSPVVLWSSQHLQREAGALSGPRLEPYPGAHRMGYLPVPVEVPERLAPIAAARERRGVVRAAFAGAVGVEDRAHKLLGALQGVRCSVELTWVVEPHARAAAEQLLDEFGVAGSVRLVEGRTVEGWRAVVAECQVAFHLHRSPFGHLAPYLQLSLLAGCVVVTSAVGEGATLPRNLVCQVEPGMGEAAEIRLLIEALAERELASLGERSRAYARERYAVVQVAEQLKQQLRSAVAVVRACQPRWDALTARAFCALQAEVIATSTAPGEQHDPCEAGQFVVPFFEEFNLTTAVKGDQNGAGALRPKRF
jgi:hypothetical protein